MSEEQIEEQEASQWQKKIEGEWYGCPMVFDGDGSHLGAIKVNRSSAMEGGKTTYHMDTDIDVSGPLRSRFEAQGFSFGVIDSDQDRVYMGPDFFGAGHPFGTLVDAHYYSPAWTCDLRTLVHILPDLKTQVYSSQLFEGPRLIGVFNGLYKMADDYQSNLETKKNIDDFVAQEKQDGKNPHILPMKIAGEWTGEFKVFNDKQEEVGQNFIKISYKPIDLLRAHTKTYAEGVWNKKFEVLRSRSSLRHDYMGPDCFGSSLAYGRALYTSQHFKGEALKIKGREFLIDDNYSMSAVWQVSQSDKLAYMMYGVLNWKPLEDVLRPTYN